MGGGEEGAGGEVEDGVGGVVGEGEERMHEVCRAMATANGCR